MMINPAHAQNSDMLGLILEQQRPQQITRQITSQIIPQLTQALLTLIPIENQNRDRSPTITETGQGSIINCLPKDVSDELKRLKDAAIHPNGGIKSFEAFVQLINQLTQALTEHWSCLPREVQQQLVSMTQPILDLFSPAFPGGLTIAIESPHVTTQSPFFAQPWLRHARTIWALIKNPLRTSNHLKYLFVVLPKFARTVQRLSDRDLKVAEFQRKLAQHPDWDRQAQIQRNQKAIAWVQARLQKDKQMTEEEKTRAALEFERIKQLLDAHRSSGNKLFSDD